MKTTSRNVLGVMGWLALAALLLCTLLIGAIAIDVSHTFVIRQDLQRTTDAAALAGAIDLFRDPANVNNHALATAEANKVDGHPVSNSIANTSVTSEVIGNAPNQSVRVTASTKVKHFLLPLIGRSFDLVQASSTAGGPTPIWRVPADDAFPLAVSLDTVPDVPGAKALKDMQIGDTLKLYINAQKFKNAAFTSLTHKSANANYINDAIAQSLGLADQVPGFIPSVAVGDNIELNNGIMGQKKLAKDPELQALINKEFAVLPVITGDPAMNQTRPIVGFIAVKFKSVEVNGKGGMTETLTCQIITAVTRGTGSGGEEPPPGIDPNDPSMLRLALQTVHLLH